MSAVTQSNQYYREASRLDPDITAARTLHLHHDAVPALEGVQLLIHADHVLGDPVRVVEELRDAI